MGEALAVPKTSLKRQPSGIPEVEEDEESDEDQANQIFEEKLIHSSKPLDHQTQSKRNKTIKESSKLIDMTTIMESSNRNMSASKASNSVRDCNMISKCKTL